MEFTCDFDMCTCSECGIHYAIPKNYRDKRRNDHKTFWCPNGHSQHFPQESEAEKYKRLYEGECSQAVDIRVRLESAQRGKRKAERALANHKKRAAAGVCPCCTRTVSQLARHMQTEHPEYRELVGLNPVQKLLPAKVQ